METGEVLYDFMKMVREDPRVGPSHISLFVSIWMAHPGHDYRSPVSVYARDLMKQARIASVGTYHKCMRDLKAYGYIGYVPSYNPVLGSLVYIIKRDG